MHRHVWTTRPDWTSTLRFSILAFALGAIVPALASEPPIDFYFTNDAVLQQHATATPPQAAEAQTLSDWKAQCIDGGEFAAVASREAPDPGMSVDERKAQGKRFDEKKFERIARATWRKANAALSQGPIRICVDLVPSTDRFTRDRMGGVRGVTAGHGQIILKIAPTGDWAAALPYALAHEMHHSYWAQHFYVAGKPFTLLDYMVFEGRADYFAGTLFKHPAPWTKALDALAYNKTWRVISKQLDATDSKTLVADMFGSPQAGIPMWAGYSIGYKLVSERMAREPTLDLAAMTAADSDAFLPQAPKAR